MASLRYHLIIDLSGVSPEKLTGKDNLEQFIGNLADLIKMKILYGPVGINGVEKNPGVTCFAVIDYSHISVHTFTDSAQAMVDIFSCKVFDQQQAVDAVLKYFTVTKEQAQVKVVSNG